MMQFAVFSLAGALVALMAPGLPAGRTAAVLGAPPPERIVRVLAGADLQAVLDAARPGDFIELPAGATFRGSFVLPNKPIVTSGRQWIVIYSSALWRLPPPGTPLVPAVHAQLMPKIVSDNGDPAIRVAAGAHHYMLAGLEVTTTSASLLDLVYLDFPGQRVEQIPTDITLYRCYIHGNATGDIRRGVALNGARLAVIGSYVSDFHHRSEDSHAIQGWNGPGPFRIIGNYLEAAGVNVMFGGEDPTIDGLVPSSIEVRGNHFFKPLTWRDGPWSVKNLFELKNARGVLVEGNIFENNWAQTQHGFALVLTPRNQSNTAPWSEVSSVTITNNIIRHATAGVNILGSDDIHISEKTRRILIRNNLFEDIGAFPGELPDVGVLFLVSDGPEELVIDHNTAVHTANPIRATTLNQTVNQWPSTGFIFTNNIVFNNGGVSGNGTPLETLRTWFSGFVFVRNVLIGGDATQYLPDAPDNFFPALVDDVGFTDLSGSDYQLAPTSPFRSMGTDGEDIGVDLDALTAVLLRWW